MSPVRRTAMSSTSTRRTSTSPRGRAVASHRQRADPASRRNLFRASRDPAALRPNVPHYDLDSDAEMCHFNVESWSAANRRPLTARCHRSKRPVATRTASTRPPGVPPVPTPVVSSTPDGESTPTRNLPAVAARASPGESSSTKKAADCPNARVDLQDCSCDPARPTTARGPHHPAGGRLSRPTRPPLSPTRPAGATNNGRRPTSAPKPTRGPTGPATVLPRVGHVPRLRHLAPPQRTQPSADAEAGGAALVEVDRVDTPRLRAPHPGRAPGAAFHHPEHPSNARCRSFPPNLAPNLAYRCTTKKRGASQRLNCPGRCAFASPPRRRNQPRAHPSAPRPPLPPPAKSPLSNPHRGVADSHLAL